MTRISGAVCVVTGATSGIGLAVAERFSAAGGRVVAIGRDPDRLRCVSQRLGVATVSADLAVPGAAAQAAQEALAVHGRVDVLVNNAGIGLAGAFDAAAESSIAQLVAVNLAAPILVCRVLVPAMLEQGSGHVVNIASIVAHTPAREETVYSATKAGLVGFSEALRLEYAARLRVSVISPGVVDTPFFERRGRAYARRWPRPISPGRVADAVFDAVAKNRDEVFVPAWLAGPARLRGGLPTIYRRLARRFS